MKNSTTKSPLVLLALACTVTVLGAQAPTVSDARLLPGDAAPGAEAGEQIQPRIAAGDDGFLAVWLDLRSSPDPIVTSQSQCDVVAARLDAAGNVLDATPIPIATTFGEQKAPRVAWNGTHYLVTWENQSPTTFFYAPVIQAVRVAPDGTVLDATPIDVLAYSSSGLVQYDLASDGNNWAVISHSSISGQLDIYGVRVAPDGTVLDPGGKSILSFTNASVLDLDVEFAVDTYLVVYNQSNRTKGVRLSRSLTKLSLLPFNIGPGTDFELDPRVGTDGNDFFVTWQDFAFNGIFVRGARVSRAGAVLDPGGLTLTADTGPGLREPAVGWDGAQWVVAYGRTNTTTFDDFLEVVRVGANGQIVDFDGVALSPQAVLGPDVVTDPAGGARLVWADERTATGAPFDIRSFTLDAALNEGPDQPVSLGASRQVAPDLAVGPGELLAVWVSEHSGAEAVLAQRVDGFGNALDPEPTVVATGADLEDARVAWSGSEYMVAWEDAGAGLIQAARLAPDATLLDATPIFVQQGHEPDVAAVGGTFLVVGWNDPTTFEVRSVYGARIAGASGAVLDATPLFLGTSYASHMRLAELGGQWILVWQRAASHDNPTSQVPFVLIAPDGSKSGEVLISTSAYVPDVTVANGVALVTWTSGITAGPTPDVYARRIAADGSFVDAGSIPISTVANSSQAEPVVAWDGEQWVFAWSDDRNREEFFDLRTDVYGARLDASATVLDPAGFALHRTDVPEIAGAAASLGDGRTLIASQVMHEEEPFGAYRLEFRTIGAWPTTGIGIAGTSGVPVLDGTGELALGETLQVQVSNARPLAAGVYVYAFSRIDLPLYGGLLVPALEGLVGFTTDAEGRHQLFDSLTSPPLSGAELFVQAWVLDPAAVQRVAATPAVTTEAQ